MKELGYGEEYKYNPDYGYVLHALKPRVISNTLLSRHPVYNQCLPPALKGSVVLKSEEEERKDKTWDEDGLRRWEQEVNGGKPWKGRELAG